MYRDNHIFVVGVARFHDLVYLCLRNRELDAEDVSHSVFVAYDQGKRMFGGDTDWDTVSMVVVKKPAEKMAAISGDGEVFTYVGGTIGQETIQPVAVTLRGLAVIDGYGYACGMKRQVFKRADEGTWVPMHAPSPGAKEKGAVIGFEAIGGFSATEIYAAGWRGEIWQYDGKQWNQIDSPTNQILTAIACAGDGSVYICGKKGTLLKGRRDAWVVIGEEGFADDLWDLHWFNDRLYASSLSRIYELVDDSLRVLDTGEDTPSTCLKLTSAEGVMWSIGTDDLFSFDGTVWTRIE